MIKCSFCLGLRPLSRFVNQIPNLLSRLVELAGDRRQLRVTGCGRHTGACFCRGLIGGMIDGRRHERNCRQVSTDRVAFRSNASLDVTGKSLRGGQRIDFGFKLVDDRLEMLVDLQFGSGKFAVDDGHDGMADGRAKQVAVE